VEGHTGDVESERLGEIQQLRRLSHRAAKFLRESADRGFVIGGEAKE
jgi:hypothetical protein